MILDPEDHRPKNPDGTPYDHLKADPFNYNEELIWQDLAYRTMQGEGLFGRFRARYFPRRSKATFIAQAGEPKTRRTGGA